MNMLPTVTNQALNKAQRPPFGWLAFAIGLLTTSQTSVAQTAPVSGRNAALVSVAAKLIKQADSVAQLTHTKPARMRIDKINPAMPNSAFFIATAAEGTVEELPTLASGGGIAALIKAVEGQLGSAQAMESRTAAEPSVFVTFTIRADGTVQQAKIMAGQNAKVNAAVLDAVERLPRLTPGQVAGTAVAVKLTIPVQVKS
jgi:TonB family protein